MFLPDQAVWRPSRPAVRCEHARWRQHTNMGLIMLNVWAGLNKWFLLVPAVGIFLALSWIVTQFIGRPMAPVVGSVTLRPVNGRLISWLFRTNPT
jgi:hypothetical protein